MADAAIVPEDAAEVWNGLGRDPKELPPKYFYDRRGSELFEAITRLPEYYLTEAEMAILENRVAPLVRSMAPARLVELAAGSGRKTRILLEAMDGADSRCYVPVDVSGEFLEASADVMKERLPGLTVRPYVADITRPGFLDRWIRDGRPEQGTPGDGPTLFAFLGSTMGNFRRAEATALLAEVGRAMDEDDALLLGMDLAPGPEKTVERLEAAYNDATGVTAEFNRNVLRVLNRRVGTDFEPEEFRHEAYWVPEASRIEMHLVARSTQVVTIPGSGRVVFQEGESVRTEISCKYDRGEISSLLDASGLVLERWMTGRDGLYAVALARASDRQGHGS